MAANKEELVSTFLDITMSNCRESASNILEGAGWNIEAAIQLFFDGGGIHRESIVPSFNFVDDFGSTLVPTGWGSEDEDETDDSRKHFDFDANVQPTGVRWPKDENEVEENQEHLNFDSTIVHTGWGSDDEIEDVEIQENDDTEHRSGSNVGTTEDSDWKEEGSSDTNLSMIYKRPICLMFHGHFHEAKVEASHLDRWLLVNVQASEIFNSHLLNRDTWSYATVQELLSSHFVFWQVNHQDNEGQKICHFYKLTSLPAILVIDPITGKKMYACDGMKQPEDLLEDLRTFCDRSPKEYLFTRTQRENANTSTNQTANEESKPMEISPASTTRPSYPPLPEELKEKNLICKVRICLLSGQRVQRSFLKTDPTKFLWSFCSTLLKEEEESQNFCFIVPNSPKLFYDKTTSFEEAGLSNALLRLSLGDNN